MSGERPPDKDEVRKPVRVIAGQFRSRQLKSLKALALRPTSDRLRETLFDVVGDRVHGARFIDVFAGTGAVGIEALSRGAREVVFVEKHFPAAALIKKNLESLDVKQGFRLLTVDAVHGLQILAKRKPAAETGPAILFLDPPYGDTEQYDRVLSFLESADFLDERSLVIAEHHRKFNLPEKAGDLQRFRVLRQGDAALSFYRYSRKTAPGEALSE